MPAIDRRVRLAALCVAVVGCDAAKLAESIADRARALGVAARLVRAELRHAEGFAVTRRERDEDIALHAHPDALADALSSLGETKLAIGAGTAFAAAAEVDLLVWIRAGESLLALPELERSIVARAGLVLEEPRQGVASALASELVRRLPSG